jgi:hypothetical protein
VDEVGDIHAAGRGDAGKGEHHDTDQRTVAMRSRALPPEASRKADGRT